MTAVLAIQFENTALTTGGVAESMSAVKGISYTPRSTDERGVFSLSAHGADQFVSWSGSSSIERVFSVCHENDDFFFFTENGSHTNIGTGSLQHFIKPGTGLLTSADRYSGLTMGAGSMAEGFNVPRNAVFLALANTFERVAPTDFEFAPLHTLTDGPAAHLLKLMRFFRDDLCANQHLEVSPIARATFQETFCLLMVQNLRHTLSGSSARARLIAPRQIRRALEFARTHAAMPITISDMAAAAGVSTRSLQANFRRFLNASPMEYLRQLRLEGARHDIVNADPTCTVVAIARRWGFTHMGRFSQEYRAAFGVVPSADLAVRYKAQG